MKKILTFLITILTVFIAVRPGLGSELSVKSRVGFGGYLVPNTLMPVLIEINRPITDGRLEIVNPGGASSSTIIDSIPFENSKRVETSFFVNEQINDLKIRLISGDQILVETEVNPDIKMFPGNLVLAVNVPAPAQHLIEQALLPSEPVLVATLPVAQLPGTALNYDGVSGLVLTDPGPVLTPVQTQALKAWLAGGGRMVIGATQSGSNSLLMALGIDANVAEHHFYPVGFGGISAFRGGFNEVNQDASLWQGWLNLKPYTRITRLMVNRVFPKPKDDSYQALMGESSKARSYLTIVLILWVISSLIIVVPGKRARVSLLIFFSVLWTAAAFPLGNWLGGIWNRGAEISSRTVIFPEAGWMLTDVQLRLNCLNNGETEYFQSSPWGGKVLLGEDDHGLVNLKSHSAEFRWRHGLGPSRTVVKAAGSGWANINGWFPWQQKYLSENNNLAALKTGWGSEMIIWDGRYFYPVQSFNSPKGQRMQMERTPEWLSEESDWLNKLNRINPGSFWLVGRGSLPEISLKIENKDFSGGFWALPLSKEVLK